MTPPRAVVTIMFVLFILTLIVSFLLIPVLRLCTVFGL